MGNVIPLRAPLEELIARTKRALADTACGPLIIASELVAVGDAWDHYKAEAGGITFAAFCQKHFGAGCRPKFWADRKRAVAILGESVRRHWHHEAAVWVANNVTDRAERDRLKKEVFAAKRRNGDNPLTNKQVQGLYAAMVGKKRRRRKESGCARCLELERELEALRAERASTAGRSRSERTGGQVGANA